MPAMYERGRHAATASPYDGGLPLQAELLTESMATESGTAPAPGQPRAFPLNRLTG